MGATVTALQVCQCCTSNDLCGDCIRCQPEPFVPPAVARDTDCATCAADRYGPPHNASLRCESGRRNHCSCDVCF